MLSPTPQPASRISGAPPACCQLPSATLSARRLASPMGLRNGSARWRATRAARCSWTSDCAETMVRELANMAPFYRRRTRQPCIGRCNHATLAAQCGTNRLRTRPQAPDPYEEPVPCHRQPTRPASPPAAPCSTPPRRWCWAAPPSRCCQRAPPMPRTCASGWPPTSPRWTRTGTIPAPTTRSRCMSSSRWCSWTRTPAIFLAWRCRGSRSTPSPGKSGCAPT
ncbi:hypothetical protein D9M69_508220 [compost metagenome]